MIITVNASKRYDIIVEDNSLKSTGEYVREVSDAKKVVVVSDSNVAPLYANEVKSSLENNNFSADIYVFKAGEASKSHSTLIDLYSFLSEKQISRKDILIALGGGVTGDLTGFAAATFLRGIGVVQIPTSLLSQIDSSVGGKTGVNITAGKNLVGAFKQPLRVICDPLVLKTLPEYFIKDGMGEIIKHAAIKSKPLLDKLMCIDINNIPEGIISDNINIKREVVEQDELENSTRMLLNFGHTLGHAAEKLLNYSGISHGMAVAAGMALITDISQRAGWTKKGTYERLCECLKKFGLPCSIDLPLISLIKNSVNDKKCADGVTNLIVLKEIGDSFIKPVTREQFEYYANL